MGWLSRFEGRRAVRTVRRVVRLCDYGDARAVVHVGDLDGSGEAPGVQLTLIHADGEIAVAMSRGEAEALAQAILFGAVQLQPSDHLKAKLYARKVASGELRPIRPIDRDAG